MIKCSFTAAMLIASAAFADQWTIPYGQTGNIIWANGYSQNSILFQPVGNGNTISFFPDGLSANAFVENISVRETLSFAVKAPAGFMITDYQIVRHGTYDDFGVSEGWNSLLSYTSQPQNVDESIWFFGTGAFIDSNYFTNTEHTITINDFISLEAGVPSIITITQVDYIFNVQPVPGPATLAGIGLLACLRRRRSV